MFDTQPQGKSLGIECFGSRQWHPDFEALAFGGDGKC